VVGIPLAIGLAVLWAFTAFLGWLVAGLWLGQLILSRSRTAARPYGAAFLGMIVLMLISFIPFVGPIMSLLGLGAVTLAGWRVLRSGGTPPAPMGHSTAGPASTGTASPLRSATLLPAPTPAGYWAAIWEGRPPAGRRASLWSLPRRPPSRCGEGAGPRR
jgi:hypothetical protein